MPNNPFTHFVLVDFENVPGIDLGALDGQPVKVTLFLGQKSKLKADLVEQITRLPFEVRLVKVGMIKKNALDFVLAYHLGEMLARYPRGHYYILSGDKNDFDPLVTYLRDNHVHVSRHNKIAELPFLTAPGKKTVPPVPPPAQVTISSKSKAPFKAAPTARIAPAKPASATKIAPATKPPKAEEKLLKLIKHLKLNQPKMQATLTRSIMAYYGNKLSPAEVAEVLDTLKNRDVLEIDAAGEVTYF